MSRYAKLLQDALSTPKPGLESEDAPKVTEAPLTPNGEVSATPTIEDKNDNLPAAETTAADPIAEPKVDASEEVGDVTVTFEDDGEIAAEVVEAEGEVDKGNDAMDTLQRASGDLGQVETRLEDSLDEGGLEPVAAQFMRDRVEGIAEDLGEEVAVPATESFGGESHRYAATVASLESVKEMAANVGKAIVAMWEKVKAFLRELFGKLVQFVGSLKARNDELKRRVAKLGSGAKASGATGKITVGEGLLNKIAVGSTVSVDAFAKIPALLDDVRVFDDNFDNMLRQDYEAITKLAGTKVDADEDGRFAEFLGVDISVHALPAVPKGFRNKSSDGGVDQYLTDVLPGNVSLALTENSAKDGDSVLAKALKRFGGAYKVERLQKEGGVDGGDADVLSITDISKVATIVDAVLVAGQKIGTQKGYDKLAFKELQPVEMSPAQKKFLGTLTSKYSQRLSYAHQASAKTLSYSVRVASNFQNYAFKSLEAYKAA